jgi:hypothetical protein
MLENDLKVFKKNLYTGKVYSIIIFVGVLKVSDEIEGSGSGSMSYRHGSAEPDPDPHQIVMDPEHWF